MLIGEMKGKHPISFVAGNYDREKFYELAKGLEHLKEGGERCFKCYALRLEETARMAKEAELITLRRRYNQSNEKCGKAEYELAQK